MEQLGRRSLIMGILMVVASFSTVALEPTDKLADTKPKIDLERMVPKQFTEWRVDETIVPLLPSPDVQAKLNKIYNQTLARTYINPSGNRIMLTIAYGGDQSDATQVHLPEVCYAAQGFEVKKSIEAQIESHGVHIPVRRVVAKLGNRNEPITYWITVGDQVVNNTVNRKLSQFKFRMAGTIPDGMLIRASSISRQESEAYKLHEQFLRDMLDAVSPADRQRLVGRRLAMT